MLISFKGLEGVTAVLCLGIIQESFCSPVVLLQLEFKLLDVNSRQYYHYIIPGNKYFLAILWDVSGY